jgi:imidazolonepropionase-like amidohydrolase
MKNMKLYFNLSPFALLILLTCTFVKAESSQESQSTGVIFENVRIFNGTSTELSAPSNVLVVGNVIKSIFAEAIADPVGMKVTRIQGGGQTLMPGLIDNHVHLFYDGQQRNGDVEPENIG